MKGILFKPEMIQAVVEGRKTVTRRVIKQLSSEYEWEVIDVKEPILMFKDGIGGCIFLKPRYHTGEVVYIKEAWRLGSYSRKRDATIIFKSDGVEKLVKWNDWLEKNTKYAGSTGDIEIGKPHQWRNSIFLLANFARHFIKILDVRAERLQEINEEDAKKEGVPLLGYTTQFGRLLGKDTYRWSFEQLWNSINKDYPWESNPWLFRYEFEYLKEEHKEGNK